MSAQVLPITPTATPADPAPTRAARLSGAPMRFFRRVWRIMRGGAEAFGWLSLVLVAAAFMLGGKP